MMYFRQIVAISCLVLLAWSVVAPAGGLNIVAVLPILATVFIGLQCAPVARAKEFHKAIGQPFRSPLSLRAPPQK